MSRNRSVEPTIQELKAKDPVFAAWLEAFKLSTAKHNEEARRRSVVCRHENFFMALGYLMMIGGAFGTLFTSGGSTSASGSGPTHAMMIICACGILMLLFALTRSGNNSWAETWGKIVGVLIVLALTVVAVFGIFLTLVNG